MKTTAFARTTDRFREALTKPITFKGTMRAIARIWKRRSEEETKVRPAQDSGLFQNPCFKPHAYSIAEQADKLRSKAEYLRYMSWEQDSDVRADLCDMEAAEKYIEAGRLTAAEKIGLEMQAKGRFFTAAKILSRSGAIPFFQLVESLHATGSINTAQKILSEFTGVRGAVKYNEMHKPLPPELLDAFTDDEIIIYSKKMLLQRKKAHILQLAELTEQAQKLDAAIELYGLLDMQGKKAKLLAQQGRFTEAGRLCLKYNMLVEAHGVAEEAAKSGNLMEAAELFLKTGDKRRSRLTAAYEAQTGGKLVDAAGLFLHATSKDEVSRMNSDNAEQAIRRGKEHLDKALDLLFEGERYEANMHVHQPAVLDAAFMLFERGRPQEAYEIAQIMNSFAKELKSPFCSMVARRIYQEGASYARKRREAA